MKKTKTLLLRDIIALSLIFFAYPTVSAIFGYLELQHHDLATPTKHTFDSHANYQTILFELVSLAIAGVYLWWRQFNFKFLNFKINRYTLPWCVLLIITAGLVADGYQWLHSIMLPEHFPETNVLANDAAIDFSLILVSFLNGFYEELFFMGLVFAVPKQTLPKAIAWSLSVRFIFHLYQGFAGALTIMTLGLTFWFFRRKTDMLLPFMLAHAVFDLFGLSLMGWWF